MNSDCLPSDLDVSVTPHVWFDLDDTVWDFTRNSADAMHEFYVERCLSRLWPTFEAWLSAYRAVNSALWERYGRGDIDLATLRSERFRRPLVEAGVGDEEAKALAVDYDADYLRRLAMRKELVPGVRGLLENLVARGFTLGILSNGFAGTQQKKLQSAGIDHLFKYVVLSEEVGVPKPFPEMFRYAEKVCGGTSASCVMIGDNPATDLAGARGAGWLAIDIHDVLKPEG